MNKRCTLNHQLIMHSALDTFEEAILQQKNKLGRNKSWYGKLCRIDNVRVFGYMTSTKIKFMVGVEDFEHGDNQWKKSSLEIEAGLKEFFVRCSPLWQLFLVLSVALISYISIVQNFLLIRIQLYLIYLFTIIHPFCYEVWCAWIVRWICIESILRTKKEKDQFTSIQHWCFSSSTVV